MPTTQVAFDRAFTYQYNIGNNIDSGPGFLKPVALARGSGDTLYVANWGDDYVVCTRITKCTLDSEWITDIGSTGTGDGQLLWPGGLALDSQENVYVTDESIHKIVVFDKDGAFLGKFGGPGAGEGEFNRPSGLAFDRDDNLYVVDTWNNRVQKLTKDGRFLTTWGEAGSGSGQFNKPWGITIDGRGDVYVADWGNDRVQKFSSEGSHLATFGSSGTGKAQFTRPSDVAVDKDGDIYVADWGNNRVQVLNGDGGYLATLVGDATDFSKWAAEFIAVNPDYAKGWDRADREPSWRFRRPSAVVVDDDFRIIVADTNQARLQIYLKNPDYQDPQANL